MASCWRDHPEAQQAYLDLLPDPRPAAAGVGAFPEASARGTSSAPLISPGAPLAAWGDPFDGTGSAFGHFVHSIAVSYELAAMIIAVGVIATLAWNASGRRDAVRQTGRPIATDGDAKAMKIGKVARLVACRWANDAAPISEAADVALGQKFGLTSGRLEIAYDTGLTVALAGPRDVRCRLAVGGVSFAG